jgi:hypothetical protein
MSNKTPKSIKDLAVKDGDAVKGGTDGLGLLAQVSHLQSQNASSSVAQVAQKQKKAIK